MPPGVSLHGGERVWWVEESGSPFQTWVWVPVAPFTAGKTSGKCLSVEPGRPGIQAFRAGTVGTLLVTGWRSPSTQPVGGRRARRQDIWAVFCSGWRGPLAQIDCCPGFDLPEHPPDIFSHLGVCGHFPVEHGGRLSHPNNDRHRPGTCHRDLSASCPDIPTPASGIRLCTHPSPLLL